MDALVTLAEAYIDESGSHDGSPLLCLAGYIFTDRRARRFPRLFQPILDANRLPYLPIKLKQVAQP